jgi:thioredoxin reductase (NADPH)
VRGVFAVGDVRYGSVKRVGGAIGEGANVVAQLHDVLEETRVRSARATPVARHGLPDREPLARS